MVRMSGRSFSREETERSIDWQRWEGASKVLETERGYVNRWVVLRDILPLLIGHQVEKGSPYKETIEGKNWPTRVDIGGPVRRDLGYKERVRGLK